LEKYYKALANRRRLAILKYLKNVTKASVGQIAKELKLRLKATSKHLSQLSAIDCLEKEQQGLKVFYSINKKTSGIIHHLLKNEL
jgi:DNA-binding transcriptional ArsR family regulator